MSHEFEVNVAHALLEDDTPALSLKLSGPVLEVNVWFALDEAKALRQVSSLGEDSKGLRLGISANSPVHWSRVEGGTIYMLIGNDAETCDIGVALPEATFLEIVREIEKCLQKDVPRRETNL